MEKTVGNYIRTDILVQVRLHPYQHAYQIDKPTDAAVVELTDWIQDELPSIETVVCAFLDIEGILESCGILINFQESIN